VKPGLHGYEHTELVPLKYGKLATKYGIFLYSVADLKLQKLSKSDRPRYHAHTRQPRLRILHR